MEQGVPQVRDVIVVWSQQSCPCQNFCSALQEHHNSTYFMFTCYVIKGIAKWLDPKCFALKPATGSLHSMPVVWIMYLWGVGGWVPWLGFLRDDALCPAEGTGSSAFLKRVTVLVVSHWLEQVVGHVFS